MNKKITLIVIIVLLLTGGAVYVSTRTSTPGTLQSTSSTEVSQPEQLAALDPATLTETYSHPEDGFSFKYPAGYKTTNLSDDTGETIVVQNDKGQGIQIHIAPMDEDMTVVTPEMIKQDIPDLTIIDPQEILIGSNGKGVAFQSDNVAFGGKSREVWFAFKRHFYQISTYMSYDPLLQAIFATWQFK